MKNFQILKSQLLLLLIIHLSRSQLISLFEKQKKIEILLKHKSNGLSPFSHGFYQSTDFLVESKGKYKIKNYKKI